MTKIRWSILFLFVVCSTVSAQWNVPHNPNRIISTDYNECQMGIKDSLGNWVVKPQYIMIRAMTSGDFEITDYDKSGVIDPDGRLIVPMIYDYVYASYYGRRSFYTVKNEQRFGVIDNSGKIIIPCKYKQIRANQDTTFSARVSWRKWYLFHRDGSRFSVPWKSRWAPSSIDSGLFVAERERWFLQNKFGLYDDSGNVLLRRKYFSIVNRGYNNTLSISTRKKKGYFTTELDTVWPMIFDRNRYSIGWRYNYWYTWGGPFIQKDGVTLEYINGRCGLINMKGDTILPFRYDYIAWIGKSKGHSVWEVSLDGESGIFDSGKGWILPVSIEALSPVASFYYESDSSYVGLFTGLKDGKFGMQTSLGEVIVPFEFMSLDNDRNNTYFINLDSVVCVTLSSSTTRHRLMTGSDTITEYTEWGQFLHNRPNRMIPDSGRFSVNVRNPGWKLYYNPAHLNDTLKHPKSKAVLPIDPNRVSDFPNDQLNASVFEVRTLKPKATLSGKAGIFYEYVSINHDVHAETERFVLHDKPIWAEETLWAIDAVVDTIEDKDHKYYWTYDGLLFRDDYKILSERKYLSCEFKMSLPDSMVYFTVGGHAHSTVLDGEGNVVFPYRTGIQLGEFNDRYAWIDTRPLKRKTHWQLLDLQTNKVVYDMGKSWKSAVTLRNDVVIDYSDKTGYFLYDVARQKTIVKGFDNITPADKNGDLFLVRSCSGKHGLMNRTGGMLVDTFWNYFTPYYFQDGYMTDERWSSDLITDPNYRYIVFYNDRSSVVYDLINKTELLNKNQLVDSALVTVDSLTAEMLNQYEIDETIYPGTIRIYIDSASRANLLPWQKSALFDSVFTRKRLEFFNPEYWWSFSSFNSCHHCAKKTKRYAYPAPNHYEDINFYQVYYASPTVLSVSGFTEYGSRRWYSNFVNTDAGVQPVTLQGMFDPRTDWRNFLINSVISYVNSHLNVEGDCHNPAGLPSMLNEDFMLSAKGIELYPEGFRENDAQMVILLPWSATDPYLFPSMKSKLPVGIKP